MIRDDKYCLQFDCGARASVPRNSQVIRVVEGQKIKYHCPGHSLCTHGISPPLGCIPVLATISELLTAAVMIVNTVDVTRLSN